MKKIWIGTVLLICLAALLWLLQPASSSLPVVVLQRPYQAPVAMRDRLGSHIPTTPAWGWAWRLEQVVFGKRKPVSFSAEVVSLPATATLKESSWQKLMGTSPTFAASNGVHVWLLDGSEIELLRKKLERAENAEVLCRPRISTADGIGSRLFLGHQIMTLQGGSVTNPVGLALDCFGRVSSHAIVLYTDFLFTTLVTNHVAAAEGSRSEPVVSVQTNFDAGLRLQVPRGKGVFLLDVKDSDMSRRRIGVFIDPLQPAK